MRAGYLGPLYGGGQGVPTPLTQSRHEIVRVCLSFLPNLFIYHSPGRRSLRVATKTSIRSGPFLHQVVVPF